MKTIVVLSRKGGTGKTTTVHAVGSGLAKRGKSVLYLDMDGQANLTLTFGANENGLSGYNVLCDDLPISKAIQHANLGDIVAGSENLHGVDLKLKGTKAFYTLGNALKEVSKQYDYCIIDTPAALGMVTINSIIAADKIIVPAQAELYSVQGVKRVVDALNEIKETCGENRKIDGILITRFNPRAAISKSIHSDLEQMAKLYKTKVYKTTIRECTALKEAELMKQSIYDYAPRSNGAKDYTDFMDEFLA